MRLAALIIGLIVGIIMLSQSILLTPLVEESEELARITNDQEHIEEAEEISVAAGGGLFIAIIMILAAGLAVKYPRASTVLFLIAAAMTIPIGGKSEFYDLMFWGALSAVCGFLSYFGRCKGQRMSPMHVQPNRVETDSSEGIATGVSAHNFCTNCGQSIQPNHNYCVSCGTELA
jgi:hypothetical protein